MPTKRLEHLIDIGSAAGSSIGALVDVFERITCVEANPDMASALRRSVEARGLSDKITVVEGVFPDVAAKLDVAQVINASNVAYNVSAIGPFLDAMDTLARSLLVIELTGYHPLWSANGAFRHFYGIERPRTPTAIDLFSIIALEHPDATLESYPLSYRRRPFSLSALRTRLGFDESRDGELEAYLANAPLPHNPSMLITTRPRSSKP
ncbi:MAG: hypothetical protein ACP5PJ_04900 [Acidimicrobiales bacterium]